MQCLGRVDVQINVVRFAQVLQVFQRFEPWISVAAKQCQVSTICDKLASNKIVGEQHELLDEAIAVFLLVDFEIGWLLSVFIELQLELGSGEMQSARLKAGFSDFRSELVQCNDILKHSIGAVLIGGAKLGGHLVLSLDLAFDDLLHNVIVEFGARSDHRLSKPGGLIVQQIAVAVHTPKD